MIYNYFKSLRCIILLYSEMFFNLILDLPFINCNGNLTSLMFSLFHLIRFLISFRTLDGSSHVFITGQCGSSSSDIWCQNDITLNEEYVCVDL